LLLVLLWQSVLTQAHHHRSLAPAGEAELVTKDKVDRGDPAPDTPVNCPICLEVANVGPALLPTPIHLPTPASTGVLTAQAQHLAPHVASQSHVWRSRAPPHFRA
jgi:hypothetical protein